MARPPSLPVRLARGAAAAWRAAKSYDVIDTRSGLWGVIAESFAGAWQHNVEVRTEDILRHPSVQACLALISGDIAKLELRLTRRTPDDIWLPVRTAANPIFNKPNRYQTRIQFFEQWILCLLIWGNVYVLKERTADGVIVAYYILDPHSVRTLVSDTGEVFYELLRDNLAGITVDRAAAPASEIIHDRYKPKYHPLVGVPPVEACALAAAQGLAIQNNATFFFRNGARPGGILTAPGAIKQETADRLKSTWNSNFSGENAGKVAVLADGLKYEPLAVNSKDAEATDQLKLTNEMVAMAFLVPLWKIGAGQMPAYGNVQAAQVDYYGTCLQTLIENIEALLDDGMALGSGLGCEFNVQGLLRMDTAGQMEALDKGKNYLTPNEGRKVLSLPGVPGGGSVYRQQQDFSLEALGKRDAKDDPFAKSDAAPANDDGGSKTMAALSAARTEAVRRVVA